MGALGQLIRASQQRERMGALGQPIRASQQRERMGALRQPIRASQQPGPRAPRPVRPKESNPSRSVGPDSSLDESLHLL